MHYPKYKITNYFWEPDSYFISDKWFHMENNSIDNAERTGKGVKFERLRRIKVYLVGTVDRWNDTKKSELNDCAKQV